MNKIDFLREGIKNLRTMGTVTRSSRFLCKEMIEPIAFENARNIVELGTGDGVITEYIMENLHPNAQLFSFELNESFYDLIKSKNFDQRFHLIEDSAEHIEEHLNSFGVNEADYIVSAIPFVMLPEELAIKIIQNCKKVLKKDGLFIQFHYSLFLKKMYEDIFDDVEVSFVPLNIPPAFVLTCRK